MKFARLLLRLVVGSLFFGHGAQKLFGWFGGHGIDGTAGFFEAIGARPGKPNAIAAGASEAGGGALLILGAGVPFAASALVATMLTAINRVHLKNGPWATDQGYEYNLVLIAAVLLLTEAGPGPLAIDGDKLSGPGWAAFALATGVAGAAAAHAYSASQPEPQPEPPAQETAERAVDPTTSEPAQATA